MPTHSLGTKFRALLATGRVANLPTVWSNVLVAFYLAVSLEIDSFISIEQYGPHIDDWLLFFACLTGSLLYIGGCMLGDYRDIQYDKKHRPNRPLVTGVLNPHTVFVLAIILFGLGIFLGVIGTGVAITIAFEVPLSRLRPQGVDTLHTLLQTCHLPILGSLVGFIILYALFHKNSRPIALMNMAICRSNLFVFAAAMGIPLYFNHHFNTLYDFSWFIPDIIIPAITVGIYTLLLASVAATESNKDKIKYSLILKSSMFFLPVISITILASSSNLPNLTALIEGTRSWGHLVFTILLYFAWMLFTFSSLPEDKPAFVSKALAGFCLLDACFAATFSPTVPLICLALFGFSLLLQKVTPAT